jgi:hypothetical protein
MVGTGLAQLPRLRLLRRFKAPRNDVRAAGFSVRGLPGAGGRAGMQNKANSGPAGRESSRLGAAGVSVCSAHRRGGPGSTKCAVGWKAANSRMGNCAKQSQFVRGGKRG